MTTLQVSFGEHVGVYHPGDLVRIGRALDNQIQVDDFGVSSHHAVIEFNGAAWQVRDLGSTNGTFWNGQPVATLPVTGRVRVSLGDVETTTMLDLVPVADSVTPELTASRSVPRSVLRDTSIGRSLLIGRGTDCAIVLSDLLASRHHARVDLFVDGRARLVDLGSANGSFVADQQAQPELPLTEGSRITIGNSELVYSNGDVVTASAQTNVTFAAVGLNVAGRLDDATFALPAGSFLAVLGTSGAGKSTLLKAITGMEPAESGSVRFDGRDLYSNFRALRHRIGYVPQDDILHDQLTIDESLNFGAQLRFPDASEVDRKARIDEVIRDLGLEPHRAKRIRNLSGGQRKRVSVGLELLHRPSLLILDEPTSGLDPGNERRLMTLLARLAKNGEGRTILVVTHSTESLAKCDQVLFLAKGGVTIYLGPPDQASGSLGSPDFPEAFAMAEEIDDPRVLRDRFMSSTHGQRLRALMPDGQPSQARLRNVVQPGAAKLKFRHDLRVFTSRYVRLLMADRRAMVTLALQAPIIAMLVALTAAPRALDPVSGRPGAGNVLMALVLGSIYAGASNASREVVKERSILRREQNFGISTAAYLLSKMLVLSAIAVAQAIVFVAIGTSRQGHLAEGLVIGSGRFELFLAIALSGISAVGLGLMVSCAVNSSDKASALLPMVLLAQFVLAGLSFNVNKFGIAQVSWLMSARWGFAATAATVNYQGLGGCEPAGFGAVPSGRPVCLGSWGHEASHWVQNMLLLGILAALFLAIAWVLLMRSDPAAAMNQDADEELSPFKKWIGLQ